MSRGRLLEPSWETGSRLMADANSLASRTLLVQNPAHRPATFIYLLKGVTGKWKRIYREVTKKWQGRLILLTSFFLYSRRKEWNWVLLSFSIELNGSRNTQNWVLIKFNWWSYNNLSLSGKEWNWVLLSFPIELHGSRDTQNWVLIKFYWWSYNNLSLSGKEWNWVLLSSPLSCMALATTRIEF